MAKGIFTQALTVLVDKAVSLDQVCDCLNGFPLVKKLDAAEGATFAGDSAIFAYKPDDNGFVMVDVYPSPWPDHMGDPAKDQMLFATWNMGHFGPMTYPNGLKRTLQQSWNWKDAQEVISKHSAVVRLRISYVFGAGNDAPVIPENYEALDELMFLTRMVTALAALDGALCYYNPNGEVALPFTLVSESQRFHAENDLPPLDLWSNIRLFNLDETWSIMDCVGNWQMDTPDHELVLDKGKVDLGEASIFIRNATLYLRDKGDVIDDGDTMDGPGNMRWKAKRFENGVSEPPRQIMRWFPVELEGVPKALLGEASKPKPSKEDKGKPFWKFW